MANQAATLRPPVEPPRAIRRRTPEDHLYARWRNWPLDCVGRSLVGKAFELSLGVRHECLGGPDATVSTQAPERDTSDHPNGPNIPQRNREPLLLVSLVESVVVEGAVSVLDQSQALFAPAWRIQDSGQALMEAASFTEKASATNGLSARRWCSPQSPCGRAVRLTTRSQRWHGPRFGRCQSCSA